MATHAIHFYYKYMNTFIFYDHVQDYVFVMFVSYYLCYLYSRHLKNSYRRANNESAATSKKIICKTNVKFTHKHLKRHKHRRQARCLIRWMNES